MLVDGTQKLLIERDLFGISDALKAVDSGYYIVYDRVLARFEVHNSRQRPTSLCLVLPYSELDRRCVCHVLRTRRERAEQLLAEMERTNAQIEREHAARIKSEIEQGLTL